jgi:hypothetical protein
LFFIATLSPTPIAIIVGCKRAAAVEIPRSDLAIALAAFLFSVPLG